MDCLYVVPLWTLILYWLHRLAHTLPIVRDFHWDHHLVVAEDRLTGPEWKNLLLWNDTWRSTVDLWLTEVIPTLVIAAGTGCWWLAGAYYTWAASIQEAIEHNPQFGLFPILPSGKWHLIHHLYPSENYGPFTVLWDYVFGTAHAHYQERLAQD